MKKKIQVPFKSLLFILTIIPNSYYIYNVMIGVLMNITLYLNDSITYRWALNVALLQLSGLATPLLILILGILELLKVVKQNVKNN